MIAIIQWHLSMAIISSTIIVNKYFVCSMEQDI